MKIFESIPIFKYIVTIPFTFSIRVTYPIYILLYIYI